MSRLNKGVEAIEIDWVRRIILVRAKQMGPRGQAGYVTRCVPMENVRLYETLDSWRPLDTGEFQQPEIPRRAPGSGWKRGANQDDPEARFGGEEEIIDKD